MGNESTNTEQDKYADELAKLFRLTLDRHGYGFQYAVIRKIDELFKGKEKWWFQVAEFPTSTGLYDTRVDFIIQLVKTRFFLAAECKRADPALNDWCFIKAPYVTPGGPSFERLFVDEVIVRFSEGKPNQPSEAFAHGIDMSKVYNGHIYNAYHIGFEIKNRLTKGESIGAGGRKAIEDAAGQVCKGANGLVSALTRLSQSDWPYHPKEDKVTTWIMGAIFTTARLWTSDDDISTADIKTGNLPETTIQRMKRVKWLCLQYPVSPALRHQLPLPPDERFGYDFGEMLKPHYMRTIAIISADGIENFLNDFTPLPIHMLPR